MTTDVHQCPRCEIREPSLALLELHLFNDHGVDLRRAPDDDTTPEAPIPLSGTIVVPVDPSRTPSAAPDVAGALARQAGMAVRIVAFPPPGLPEASVSAYLRREASHLATAEVPGVSSHVLDGDDAASAIVADAGDDPADLVCMATHSRRALGEFILGSVSESVVRSSRVPVLLVGPHAEPADQPVARVIVALDGSYSGELALEAARPIAARLAADLILVEVVDEPMPSLDVDEAAYLHRVAASVGGDVEYDTLHGPDPAEAIVRSASDAGSLIVVGTGARTGLRRFVKGSVALDVVRKATCPVLVVPPGVEASDDVDAVDLEGVLG